MLLMITIAQSILASTTTLLLLPQWQKYNPNPINLISPDSQCYDPWFSVDITGSRSSFSFRLLSVSSNVSLSILPCIPHVASLPFFIHESVSSSDVFPSVLPSVTCRILIHVSYLYLTWNYHI
jgi:hypothetical protein